MGAIYEGSLDNIITPGFYYGSNGFALVLGHGNYIDEICWQFQLRWEGNYRNTINFRQYTRGSWTEWVTIISS